MPYLNRSFSIGTETFLWRLLYICAESCIMITHHHHFLKKTPPSSLQSQIRRSVIRPHLLLPNHTFYCPSLPPHLVAHERGNGAPHLVVALAVARGSQHDEDEPGRDGDLRQVTEIHAPCQTHEGNDWVRQEVHFTDKHVGRFRTWRIFFMKLLSGCTEKKN